MAETQTIRQLPPEFIEAAGKTYLSDLQKVSDKIISKLCEEDLLKLNL